MMNDELGIIPYKKDYFLDRGKHPMTQTHIHSFTH